jgi:hypothetical protein
MFAFDQRATSVLVNRVYTTEIILDYDTLLIGKGIENIASSEWAKRLETMHDHFDTTQHIVQWVSGSYSPFLKTGQYLVH